MNFPAAPTLLVAATAAAHGGSFGTGDPYEPGDWLGLILALNGEAFHALVGPFGWFPWRDDPMFSLEVLFLAPALVSLMGIWQWGSWSYQ